MKILWVSPRWPLPVDTGAKKAMMTILEDLKKSGLRQGLQIEISTICLVENSISNFDLNHFEAMTGSSDNLILNKNRSFFKHQFINYIIEKIKHPFLPFTYSRCSNKVAKLKLNDWMLDKNWDITVLDGLHGGALLNLEDKRLGAIVYRAHNVESDLWLQMIKKEPHLIKKWVFKLEHCLFKAVEQKVVNRSQLVLTVSDVDRLRFLNLMNPSKIETFPIGISFLNTPLEFPTESTQINLLFVGRLDWLPNKEGLQWFLKCVWPELDKNINFHLDIVGSGESEWLNSYSSERIQIHRNVPELKPFYKVAHLTLIPLFLGSGTRVKAIEASSLGRSFISTQLGVEGLPFDADLHYIAAETKEEWIQKLNTLHYDTTKILAHKIYEITSEKFDQSKLSNHLVSLFAQFVD